MLELKKTLVEGDISHLNISGIGSYSHSTIDNHIDNGAIHFSEASIAHSAIANLNWAAAGHTIDQALVPDGDNARDLGVATTGRWKDLYLSGNISLEFGDLVSEQNPDAVDAFRIKATGSDVDVVLGDVTGYFSVWNVADNNAVFYVNNDGDTDIAGNFTTTGTAFLGLIDLGTNTIDDTSMTGDWAFNSGNLSGIGTLGVGTSIPQRDLHIESGVPTIRMSDNNAVTDQAVATLVEFYRGNNTNRVGFLGMESSGNNNLKISTDYAAGQITLGTGNNVTALTIDNVGNTLLDGNLTVNEGAIFNADKDASKDFVVKSGATGSFVSGENNLFVDGATGYVSINDFDDRAPGTNLHIVSAFDAGIRFSAGRDFVTYGFGALGGFFRIQFVSEDGQTTKDFVRMAIDVDWNQAKNNIDFTWSGDTTAKIFKLDAGTEQLIWSGNEVLIKNKIAFTQTDLNEYIDSLADGYMDYGATIAHRFLADVDISTKNIITDTTTGTKIGTATAQKIGFWNVTPVVQPSHIVDADGLLADITAKFNTLLAQLATTGLQASA